MSDEEVIVIDIDPIEGTIAGTRGTENYTDDAPETEEA